MKFGKKTKIVCTIGPSTESKERLEELIDAGMNVMRLNFSHGNFSEHQKRIDSIREIMKEKGEIIAIMQDLCGPKIRIGDFEKGMINLEEGQTFILTSDEVMGNKDKVFVNYPSLSSELKIGGFIMLDDGKKKLQIIDIKNSEIITKVIVGGELGGRKGVNLPDVNLSISSLTEKDKNDLKFGIKNDVDFIALSFVRKPEDILELRNILDKAGSKTSIIAKIETQEAIDNIDEIMKLSDGIMVARGDLAIQIPAEEVPIIQKMLIRKCNSMGKPVITATQMLESMLKNPVPTRAEVSDIANAIIDGTDAIMLSEETTIGDYPIEVVKVMTKVALEVEKDVFTSDTISQYEESLGSTDATSRSAVMTSHEIGARFIVAFTESGRTARMISRYRPKEMILAMTLTDSIAHKLSLSFGCFPIVVNKFSTVSDMMDEVKKIALENKLANTGDKVVISTGIKFDDLEKANMMLIETI